MAKGQKMDVPVAEAVEATPQPPAASPEGVAKAQRAVQAMDELMAHHEASPWQKLLSFGILTALKILRDRLHALYMR